MDTEQKRNQVVKSIHNKANDLKSGIINWKQFDASIQEEINELITFIETQ